MDERPWDPPRYEHKSGMIIPRYANTGVLCASGTCLAPTEAERRKDCGSATHGTIRRHHSWGLLTPTSYNNLPAIDSSDINAVTGIESNENMFDFVLHISVHYAILYV